MLLFPRQLVGHAGGCPRLRTWPADRRGTGGGGGSLEDFIQGARWCPRSHPDYRDLFLVAAVPCFLPSARGPAPRARKKPPQNIRNGTYLNVATISPKSASARLNTDDTVPLRRRRRPAGADDGRELVATDGPRPSTST